MMLGPIWPKLDLGLESDEDILEQFVAHTPELEQEIRLVFSDLSTIVREYEGSVDWIESLKARGYHTYYPVSYTHLDVYKRQVQKLPEDQLLDALRHELENWND